MKGDFTRVTFDPARHFSRVLMQQGRVQLDADFNEQASILLHYMRTLATDLIGPYCGPGGDKVNFAIYPDDDSPPTEEEYHIGMGRYYVDGILVENDNENATFCIESYNASGIYVVYLDVWERHITHVQDSPQISPIREAALGAGGPDTCTRVQVVWQVRYLKVNNANNACDTATNKVKELRDAEAPDKRPVMAARLNDEEQRTDACSIPPESRYRGMENHLYRIEVHRGGQHQDGTTNNAVATFKWSRDNGSVVFPIVSRKGDVLFVEHLGRDQRTGLRIDDWVEIIDDDQEMGGEPGNLAQVKDIDTEQMSVTVKKADGGSVPGPGYDENSKNHPLLRRWDQRKVEGLTMDDGAILIPSAIDGADVWIEIEDGIEVAFPQSQNGNGTFRTGDYWLIPARVATGDIEWPKPGGDEDPVPLPPQGIEHHYAPLAVIESGGVTLCRSKLKKCCT